MVFSHVASLGHDVRVYLMDAYGDGTVWASLADGQDGRTQVCIDGRQGSPTRHRLFEQARHPRMQTAVLIELGAPEEGVIIPLLSRWLDSGGPQQLGLTEAGKEIIQASLLRYGEPPGTGSGILLEIVVPHRMEASQRQEIELGLATALEAGNVGRVTGGGSGGGITDFFIGVTELATGLTVIRRVLREHELNSGTVIKQYEPAQVVHRLRE